LAGDRPANQEQETAQAGQVTDAGPAVVANFTAAALESSRAVSQSSQTADQNRASEESQVERAPAPPPDSESSIDTYA